MLEEGVVGLEVWEVVGGGDRGGVLVREGLDVSSWKYPQRLSTGSFVEELLLCEDRLHYRLLRGTGPETGWVSTRLPHKDLLVKRWGAGTLPEESGTLAAQAADPVAAAPDEALELSGNPAPVVDADPVVRASLENKLHAGSRQLHTALCEHSDLALFNALKSELTQGIRPWSGNWRPAKDGEWRTPWRNGMGSEQVEDLKGKALWAHASVLDKLADTFNAEIQMWWTNFYEDGSVGCEFHHDGHAECSVTAGASFGAPRDLSFVHDATGCTFAFRQENGDVFAFDASVDSAFTHGVFPVEESVGPRISVIMMGRVKTRSISTKLESLQQDLREVTEGSPSARAWLQGSVRDLWAKRKRFAEKIQKQADMSGDGMVSFHIPDEDFHLETMPEVEDCSLRELDEIIRKLQDSIGVMQGEIHRLQHSQVRR
mmetsp:Transcript_1982/g.6594  ORF Transcript_1982/g.6594 Transcript_1982/m.6594 type:complete len:429 (+) Transcript_1982:27-1313(+)